MAVTYASFIILFPAFTTADSDEQDRITAYIALASNSVPSSVWDTWTDEGISFLTAHILTLANQAGAGTGGSGAGALTKVKVGQLEKTYGFSMDLISTENGLLSTSYGQRYLQLRNQLSLTPMTI